MRRIPCLATVAVALLLVPVSRADVIVVDQADPSAYQVVQLAIDAANPGDVVLIRPGTYVQPNESTDPILVTKSLTIVGDVGGETRISALRVRNLEPDERVVLRHLTIRPMGGGIYNPQQADGLKIRNAQGVVLVEDGTITGAGSNDNDSIFSGLRVLLSPNVVVSRSTIRGGEGEPKSLILSLDGGPGVRVEDARVALYHATITGGDGDSVFGPFPFPSSSGGPGMLLEASPDVRLFGVTITGGEGGDSTFDDPGRSEGGDGLVIQGPAVVRAVDATWSGGAGGGTPAGGNAASGVDLVQLGLPGTLLTWDDVVPELEGPGVAREGESITITARGEPGELVRLYFALDFLYAPLSNKKGVFVPGSPKIGPLAVGTMPPSGELQLPLVAPDLVGLGLEGVVTTWQAYARVDGTSELVMSNPYELVLLAASF